MDISFTSLLWGFLLILIPACFLYHYKTGLVRDTIVAAIRMTVQLFLIGFYLKYMFNVNLWWLNLLWVIIMAGVASHTVIHRTRLPLRRMFIPVTAALVCSIALIDFYFMGLIVRQENLFDARYFIPVSGMILGNMLSANVIALNTYYGSLKREHTLYLYRLANGATAAEARAPFMRDALVKSFNPTIASMAVMGLIALPGTMTGQILGGADPDVAIKYQTMLMICIFASSLISVLLTLFFTRRHTFDHYDIPFNDK
ncbi:MAG: ABC transporter permease [Candidatus Aphodosoma sp.]